MTHGSDAPMPDGIFTATTADDYAAFERLVREYVEFCRERYQDDSWLIDQTLNHQSFDRELEQLAVSYGPPQGKAFLVRHDGEICGCGAYRKLTDEICEMKRLFVPSRFRGKRLGRMLCETIIDTAREDNFKIMRLDTANLMTEAIAVYESFGFRRCAPYNDYPDRLMPYIIFMELPLVDR